MSPSRLTALAQAGQQGSCSQEADSPGAWARCLLTCTPPHAPGKAAAKTYSCISYHSYQWLKTMQVQYLTVLEVRGPPACRFYTLGALRPNRGVAHAVLLRQASPLPGSLGLLMEPLCPGQ